MKKNTVLRKDPRIHLNLAALIILDEKILIPCRIINSSKNGFGIEVEKKCAHLFKDNKIRTSTLRWSLVPSLPMESWKVRIQRVHQQSIGLEIEKDSQHPLRSKILDRLIRFHLNLKN